MNVTVLERRWQLSVLPPVPGAQTYPGRMRARVLALPLLRRRRLWLRTLSARPWTSAAQRTRTRARPQTPSALTPPPLMSASVEAGTPKRTLTACVTTRMNVSAHRPRAMGRRLVITCPAHSSVAVTMVTPVMDSGFVMTSWSVAWTVDTVAMPTHVV